MKKGFTLIELMILMMILAVLAMSLYPSYNSIQTRAMEAKVRGNMHAAQLAVEEFATVTEGLYPQDFMATVCITDPSQPGNNTSVAGTAGGINPVASTPADPVLLPIDFKNPLNKFVGWAFASLPGAVPPAATPATVVPACGAALDAGSIYYLSADAAGNTASYNNAAKYIIYGCGMFNTLPSPLSGKQ